MLAAEYEMLRRTWFPVARVADVDKTGLLGANILGEDLVVYRTDGVSTVAGAYCPHRGMDLTVGQMVKGELECPYHGWRFAPGSGTCTAVPSLPDRPTPPRSNLRVYPSREAYGHVWAALDTPDRDLPAMPEASDPDWQFEHGGPTDLGCGLRQVTENFRDMSHFAFVHRGSMGPNVQQVVDPYKVHRDGIELRWTLDVDLGGTAMDGNTGVAGKQRFDFYLAAPMFATVKAEFPGGGHSLVVQFATPITTDGEKVRHFWSIGIDSAVSEKHGASMAEMRQWEQEIFDEDFPIMERLRPREAPLDLHSQAHTRSDKFSLEYRRIYQELIDGRGTTAASAA
ncbi:aromatic ring-hydroxylating dioxygenase subunit alpha [Micromonospora sp. NPDC126480]|uniref:aromatic ring-hydroxylating dioxygenase subunit alpha n=1 Tax=Micromonospora sp. NPDC126480 TaxID=3155312 RepID=UPI003333D52E